MAGNHEAGGFVNHEVFHFGTVSALISTAHCILFIMRSFCTPLKNPIIVLFTKPSALRHPGFAWYNSCGTEKCPLAVNGSHQLEWSLKSVLYGGTQSGSFVNSAVSWQVHNGDSMMSDMSVTRMFPTDTLLMNHCVIWGGLRGSL